MQTSELKIFLASPLEMSRERILIGSHLGLLNTYYEESDKYITLNKWEDYNATYVGIRTQTAYNTDLLEPSDIVIILLYDKTGTYTVEEFEKAKELNKKIIVAIKHDTKGSKVPDEVIAFSNRIKHSKHYYKTWDFDNDTTLIDNLEALVVENLGKYTTTMTNIKDRYCCYVAFSEMMKFGAEELRDTIRAFDQRKRSRGHRCMTLPFKTPALIPFSHYNFCLYFEEPDNDLYKDAEKMYELADAKRSKLLRCKFINKNYINLPFDSRFPQDFGQTFDIGCYSDEIHIDNIKDSLLWILSQHHEKFYQDKEESRYTFRAGKLFVDGIECPINESIVSIIGEDIIAKLKLADAQASQTDVVDETDKVSLLHTIDAEKIRGILNIRYPSLIRLSSLLEDLPVDEKILPNEVSQLWRVYEYDDLIEIVKFKDISIAKEHNKHSLTDPELSVKLALCNIKLKAIFRSNESSRYKVLITSLLEERLNITNAIFKKTNNFVEDVIVSYILLALYNTGNNYQYYRILNRFLQFVDKINNEEILADCEFRFFYAAELIGQGQFNRANHHLEIGFKKLSQDSINKGVFDYQLGNHIFQLIETYLRQRIYLYEVKRWIGYWEGALQENKNNSTKWNLSFLMMTAAKFRTFNINSRADDKEGLNLLNEDVNDIFIKAISSYIDLDDSLKLDLAYTANILGVYYTDRVDFAEDKKFYRDNALYYLKTAEYIINEVREREKWSVIPFFSQTYHNLGRTYDVHGSHEIALDYYRKAYKFRKFMYDTDRNENSAELLAETATNLSGALLFYDPQKALDIAKEAESLYVHVAKRRMGDESEMNVLKARQLIATIYYNNDATRERGLQIMQEIWKWVDKHPDCSYFMSFMLHTMVTLIENNLIPYRINDEGYFIVELENGTCISLRPGH